MLGHAQVDPVARTVRFATFALELVLEESDHVDVGLVDLVAHDHGWELAVVCEHMRRACSCANAMRVWMHQFMDGDQQDQSLAMRDTHGRSQRAPGRLAPFSCRPSPDRALGWGGGGVKGQRRWVQQSRHENDAVGRTRTFCWTNAEKAWHASWSLIEPLARPV